MSEQGVPVELYIYDLTLGFASLLAPAIIGRAVEGVWHTAVVAYGREFFYGAHGITSCAPGSTQLGAPQRVERLGETFVPYPVFADYLRALAASSYTPGAYNLLSHNCNHFSDEAAGFLCGGSVPKHILRQPEELLSGGQRAALDALLASVAPAQSTQYRPPPAPRTAPAAPRQDSPDYDALNTQIEEARAASRSLEAARSSLADKLRRKERRKEKKRKKQGRAPDTDDEPDMAEAATESASVAEVGGGGGGVPAGPSALGDELDERRRAELQRRERNPPIVYKDIDGLAEFEQLSRALEGCALSAEERQSLDELQQYLRGEGSWVLGDDFLAFVGRLLADGGVKSAVRVLLLRCLAAGALREDISLVLHQDRRHHALLNYAHRIDRHPVPEQTALATLMCNLFENISSSEWLLYISEWDLDGQPLSNIRATTKVAVHATLAEEGELRDIGTALMYNVATKEVKTVRSQAGKALRDLLPRQAKAKVFDEVCVELCMALLQLLQLAPGEEQLWRALAALARLAAHSSDVPQLIACVGPDPAAYRGTSARVDEQIDNILKKLK